MLNEATAAAAAALAEFQATLALEEAEAAAYSAGFTSAYLAVRSTP